MANRNAARHLALVASILICFFVYMGYRYRGQPEAAPRPADSGPVAPVDIAQLLADAGDVRPAGAPGAPAGNGAGEVPAGRSPAAPPSAAAGRTPGVGESFPAPPADASVKPDDRLRPPPPAASTSPSGSIEETTASTASGSSTIITGLVPDPADNQPDPAQSSPAGPPRQAETGPASLQPPGSPSPRPAPAQTSGAAGQIPPPPRAGAATGQTPPPAAARPPQAAAPRPPAASPETVAPRPVRTDPPPPPALRLYVIRPGDTLSRIAARELGSISLANNIYLLNRDVIADPDRLMAGDRIRLPSREAIDGARDQAPPSPGGGQPERQTHRVAAGDTLSSIALRYYDSSASWRGIFAANRDILSNPNRLEVGMELVIPPEAE